MRTERYVGAKQMGSKQLLRALMALTLLSIAACGSRNPTRSSTDARGVADSAVLRADSGVPSVDATATQPSACPPARCVSQANCAADEQCYPLPSNAGAADPLPGGRGFAPGGGDCPGVCVARSLNCSSATTTEPKLAAALYEQDGGVEALVLNIGCTTVYRLEGCCFESAPQLEEASGGSFKGATCQDLYNEPCCDALPSCVPLKPGQAYRVSALTANGLVCCGGKRLRGRFVFSRHPGCVDDALYPVLTATTNDLLVPATLGICR
ncbi:MAG: hypothetical protein H6707_12255 [Deltaproteobacteria bacterium]|nr:hypothetical protein [Deltaproteobacteria bacterium]